MRVFAVLSVCMLTLLLLPRAARAQSQQPGDIVVVVTDTTTKKPIDNAHVFLLGGDTPQSSLTNAKGLLIFERVQPGVYRVKVKADGYADSDAAEADVGEGQRVDVVVALAPALRTIASVVARSSISVTSEEINANSPERKVSQSLIDALGKIAGVDVENDLYGSDSAFNISLRGADASQTGYSIDGVQVRGAAAQAMSGFQDLFGGASVDFSPSAISPGGMVNFFTAQPTKLLSYHFTGLVGNYSNTMGTWTVSGGAGKAAFVYERAAGGQDMPLDGQRFTDSTGQTYVHQGGFARQANLFKAGVSLSSVTSFKYSLLTGTSARANICSSDTTLLPCGFGPGDILRSNDVMQSLNVSSLIGHLQFNLGATIGTYHFTNDDPNRAVNGVRNPFFANSSNPWFGTGVRISSSAGRHTISGGYTTYANGSNYTTTYDAASTTSEGRTERFGSLSFGDRVKSNDKLALNYTLSQSAGTGAGSSLQLDADATWQPQTTDVFNFSIGLGSAQPAPTFDSVVGDALTAQYDCYNGSVFVNGPSDEATKQSRVQYDASWQHTWKRGQLNASVYRNAYDGQGLFASVPFAAEPPSLFPGGPAAYLASLQHVWSEPTVCGSTPFDPSRVYVSQYVSNLNQISQGFTVSGRFAVNRNVEVLPHYAVTSSALSSLDPRLSFPGSYFTMGTQLRGHPLRTAGVTVLAAMPRERMEWAFNAQFTGANNWNNLPAYTLYNAGLVVELKRGSLRFFEGNIFGTHTGFFTTYQGVNPLPVQGGGQFAIATTPLEPRSFSVEYDIHWQQHPAPKPSPAPKPALQKQ
ncbi:MAG TPA: TonB-dependent receptor [Candidatus Baltobacteraceae bacterium]|nr:TonB-dependent receptor [Candidatus Baltobacteraceae bacterium]